MAHCDVYREQLGIAYPLLGYALWEPTSVEVGDVGCIRDGKFLRLFNVLHPEGHPSNTRFGVPDSYEQLIPRISDHMDGGTLRRNHYFSAGVNVTTEPEHLSTGPEDFPMVSFSNSGRRGGAVLHLPIDARRQDTHARRDFGQWMLKHIDSWLTFARQLGLGIKQMEEIVLVTGCHRTRSWANIAFLEGRANAQASFGVKVDHDPAVSIEWQFPASSVRGAMCGWGPEGKNLPEDQCIFIRGFRVFRLFGILPRHLRGAAGSDSSMDPDPDNNELGMATMSLTSAMTHRDPLHVLLEYIAKQAPVCDVVLVHDDDLAQIYGVCDSMETLQPDAVMSHLQRSKPEIRHVVCNSASANSRATGTETTTVAMFSKEFQEWGRAIHKSGDAQTWSNPPPMAINDDASHTPQQNNAAAARTESLIPTDPPSSVGTATSVSRGQPMATSDLYSTALTFPSEFAQRVPPSNGRGDLLPQPQILKPGPPRPPPYQPYNPPVLPPHTNIPEASPRPSQNCNKNWTHPRPTATVDASCSPQQPGAPLAALPSSSYPYNGTMNSVSPGRHPHAIGSPALIVVNPEDPFSELERLTFPLEFPQWVPPSNDRGDLLPQISKPAPPCPPPRHPFNPPVPPPHTNIPEASSGPSQNCIIPGCPYKAYYNYTAQEQTEYCGQGHELQAISTGLVNSCAMCKGRPRRTGERVCGRTCRERERQARPVAGIYNGVKVVRHEPRTMPGP